MRPYPYTQGGNSRVQDTNRVQVDRTDWSDHGSSGKRSRRGTDHGADRRVTGIDRATVHRAIVSLERIGFVDRDPRSRSVRLGTYLFSLGAKTARRFSTLSHAREVVTRVAEQTGDTSFLTVRNKYDGVCIDICSGGYPLKAQTLSIGESLPLGVSSGGLAILAAMSDADRKHVIQYNTIKINEFHRVKPQDLYQHVEETRQRGYSIYCWHIVASRSGRPPAAAKSASLTTRSCPSKTSGSLQALPRHTLHYRRRT